MRARRLVRFRNRSPGVETRGGYGLEAIARGCQTKFVGVHRSTDVVRATSTARGLVRARLQSRGDWDVAVFDAKSKRLVAASAAFRGNEVAEGFVKRGERLLVQACRFAGKASRARVSVSFLAEPASRQLQR
jgi:hypothetical protein